MDCSGISAWFKLRHRLPVYLQGRCDLSDGFVRKGWNYRFSFFLLTMVVFRKAQGSYGQALLELDRCLAFSASTTQSMERG
jgi:hypothetical protein